jgi:hypothetical protein
VWPEISTRASFLWTMMSTTVTRCENDSGRIVALPVSKLTPSRMQSYLRLEAAAGARRRRVMTVLKSSRLAS